MKDNLGHECVKGGLLSFQGKTGTISMIFLEKWQFFRVLFYFSTCPFLKSGIPTHPKIIFWNWAIIRIFARKVS